jgi:hypothetical protein
VTAKRDIEAIKNMQDLSDSERVWQAIDKLAEHIDNTPKDLTDKLRRAF